MFSPIRNAIGLMLMLGLASSFSAGLCSAASASNATVLERSHIRSADESEGHLSLLKVNTLNFEYPERPKHNISLDDLAPIFPNMEINDATTKGLSATVTHFVAPIWKDGRSIMRRQGISKMAGPGGSTLTGPTS